MTSETQRYVLKCEMVVSGIGYEDVPFMKTVQYDRESARRKLSRHYGYFVYMER